MSEDAMLSAVTFIQSLDVDEIEEVLDWLDQLTSAYRTILVVKRLLDRKPEVVELPECLVNQFGTDRSRSSKSTRRSAEEVEELRKILQETMKKHPQGIRPKEIAEKAGLDSAWVSGELNSRQGVKYYKLERARWVYLNGKTVRDYLQAMPYMEGETSLLEQESNHPSDGEG